MELVNGEATFSKLQISEVTSHFDEGWVYIVVYPVNSGHSEVARLPNSSKRSGRDGRESVRQSSHTREPNVHERTDEIMADPQRNCTSLRTVVQPSCVRPLIVDNVMVHAKKV